MYLPDANILILICQVQVTIKIERLEGSCSAPEMILRTSLRRQIVRCTANLSKKIWKILSEKRHLASNFSSPKGRI